MTNPINALSISLALLYAVGKYVTEPNTSDDIRLECAPGIHFYMTRAEAEEHQ